MGFIEDLLGGTTQTGNFNNIIGDIFGSIIPPGTTWSYTDWPDINPSLNVSVDTSPLVLPILAVGLLLVLK